MKRCSPERIVAFTKEWEGGAEGTIARFCSLREAREFLNNTLFSLSLSTSEGTLLSKRASLSQAFKNDYDEGHRYCSCQD